jgi:RNase P/RNase MRP subunit p29
MRWPDIFFKVKAPTVRSSLAPGGTPPTVRTPPANATSAGSPPATKPATAAPTPAPMDPAILKDAPAATPATTSTPQAAPAPAPAPVSVARSEPAPILPPDPANLVRRPFSQLARKAGTVKSESPPTAPAAVITPAPSSAPTPTDASTSPAVKHPPTINLSAVKDLPAASTVPSTGMSFVRRRTKIADVARIVLPPRRDDSVAHAATPPAWAPVAAEKNAPTPETPRDTDAPASSSSIGPAAAIMPPAFPVSVEAGTVMPREAATPLAATTIPLPVPPPTDTAPVETISPPFPEPVRQDVSPAAVSRDEGARPEAIPYEAASSSADSSTFLQTQPAPDSRERREFILANGERVIGAVLSETPEAIYIDHATLGVLTIPRAQIAQRPIEIILINGDRIVGDVVAETAETLFVRHASLGILTVPHAQRSTRVVEAILKDGDRILGEVLGETENFTVIRSATLGTVAVPHARLAMLNRKLEQMQMKSLPPAAPELENRPPVG